MSDVPNNEMRRGREVRRVTSQEELVQAWRDGFRPTEGFRVPIVTEVARPSEEGVELGEAWATAESTEELIRTGMIGGFRAQVATPDLNQAVATQARERAVRRNVQNAELEAGIMGAADTVFFGQTAGAVEALTGDEGFGEFNRALQEANPTAAGFGTAAGVGLGLFGAPIAGATGVARGVSSLARRAGAGRVSSGLIDGTIGGALDGLTQAYIEGNPDEIAERMFAGAGLGLLTGGVFDGGAAMLGMGARAGTRGARRLMGQVDSTLTGSEGILSRTLGQVQEGATGINPFRRGIPEAEAAWRQIEADPEAFLREFGGELAESQRLRLQVMRDLDNFGQSSVARETAEQLDGAAVRTRVRQATDGMLNDLNSLTPGPTLSAALRPVRQRLEEFSGGFATTGSAGDALAETMRLRGDLRELIGKLPDGDPQRIEISALTRQLDDALADETVMGGMVPLLAQRNQMLDEMIGSSARLRSIFGEDMVGDVKVSSGALQKKLREIAEAGDEDALMALETLVDMDADRLASVGVSRELGDVAGRARSLSERLEKYRDWATVKRAERQENQGSGLLASVGFSGNQGSAVGGAVLGGVLGGPAGALLGGIGAVAISRPVGTAKLLGRLTAKMRGQQGRATAAANQFRKQAVSPDRVPFTTRLRASKNTIGAILLNGSAERKTEEYQRLADEVENLMNDPELMADRVAGMTRDLAQADPNIPESVSMLSTQALMALVAALPASRNSRRSRMDINVWEYPPSLTEVDDFLEVASVVEDPIFGLEMMNAGQLSPRAAQAMAQSYPRMWSQMVAHYQSVAAEAGSRRSGAQLNYQMVAQLSTLSGAALDPTFEPDFLMAMQSQHAQTTAQEHAVFSRPVSTRRATNLSDSALTRAQQLESR